MKILKKIEWAFIDLDGTIADSLEKLYQIYLEFLEEFKIKGTKKEFNKLNGPNLIEIIKILKNNYHLQNDEKFLYDIYFNKLKYAYRNDIKPFSNTKQILEYLFQNDIKIMLITSSMLEFTQGFLEENKLLKYFNLIVSGESVKNSKPHPEIYEIGLSKINSSNDKIIVLEDSINGIISAKNAGLKCIRKEPNLDLFLELKNYLEDY